MTPRDYFAYGLQVRSPVSLPFASPCMRAASGDVTVRFGDVPATLPTALHSRHGLCGLPEWEAAPGVFLFRSPGVAHYLVTEGRKILVQPRGGDDREIGKSLAGEVWWALLLQRGIVPFHGSAVAFEEGAVLFLGCSGVGKSSLLGALLKRGYAMLADDIAGVAPGADSRIQVLPAYPRLRLNADTLNALGWRKPPANEQSGKYLGPVRRFHTSPLPIRALFLLNIHNRSGIEIEMARGVSIIKMLRRQAMFGRVARGLAWRKEFLQIVFAMAMQAPVARVTRPAYSFHLDALADRIEEHVREVSETPHAETWESPAMSR